MLFDYPVLLQGNAALCACNHRFLAVIEGGKLVAASEKATEREIMTVSFHHNLISFQQHWVCIHRCGVMFLSSRRPRLMQRKRRSWRAETWPLLK